ncbi:DEAD/DEAH box helicase [Carboxylicivirga sp. M1479]|uniref:DEAD/DEAH box helicase n=1 Tax=Carboxylicivirga sp. M1479 TaxID=2594476 RepID=UPI00117895A9|nr:DEAD/DEAH box helicase [Carboxylicivirga sp. M1479]TRX61096.1 DEAD/DEAH box helicase [Carboxylicivirga sp. M1479]
MSFSSLGLSPSLLQILADNKYTEAYPIQKEAIPAIIQKKDILGIAKTGSGKTASYVLPLLMNQEGAERKKNRHVNALVLVPTRELATQVLDVFKLFSAGLTEPVKTQAVFGGVSINPQMIALQGVNILVATPGRLLELLDANALHISDIDTLVLDEADKMLNMGFKDEMDRIFAQLPKKRQNLLFSATLSEDIKNIQQLVLHKPQVIKIDEEKDPIDLIQQTAYFVDPEKKGPLLRHLIASQEMDQVLIFTSSIQKADQVANKLRNNGIEARPIHSKKSQGARTDLLTKFKYKKLRVLVATDLLARGIDIEFLPYVINYELPRSPKDFIHRIGRTGRAESPGEAISLITPEEEHHFKVIQKKMKKWVDRIDGNVVLEKQSGK